MGALLQAFGLGLGALCYVLVALALARGARDLARGSVALYWRLRTRAEVNASIERVVRMQARRPERSSSSGRRAA
jgi:hypothetical protein